jgi:hypothetical protein
MCAFLLEQKNPFLKRGMEKYLLESADILERRERVEKKIEMINKLPGWKLDRNQIQALPIRKAEDAVRCVAFIDSEEE